MPHKETTTNQLLGIVRFSHPAMSGFRKNYQTEAEQLADLYEDSRIEFRLKTFEHLCLQSLVQQTDSDFRLAVLIGDTLPPEYKKRLEAMLEPYPFEIVSLPRMKTAAATQKVYDSLKNPEVKYTTTFRLDDDDALAKDYIAELRQSAKAITKTRSLPGAITFLKGICLDLSGSKPGLYSGVRHQSFSAGCALVTHTSKSQTIYRPHHGKLNLRYTTISNPKKLMFLRSLHEDNDSEATMQRELGLGFSAISQKKAERIFRRRFGWDVNDVVEALKS